MDFVLESTADIVTPLDLGSESLKQSQSSAASAAAAGGSRQERVYPVSVYRHQPSGLRFVFADTGMPSAYTSIVVPTQSWDNRGLPHTLEHLIFTGSKQHPHKGFLETVAMRELAEYSNASTHSHFTEYNADCTCAEGLAELIPVYLDHILRPLLTDKQFVTEVYHVAPDGSGKGVVFSEMQGRENTSWDLVENTFGSTLYPKDVPHAHETGGLTPDIAILTNKDIRAFHAAFYRPEYITVLVAGGNLVPERFFAALDAHPVLKPESLAEMNKRREEMHIGADIAPHGLESLALPRVIDIPRWPAGEPEFISRTIIFPGSDEDTAEITYSWHGAPLEDVKTFCAVEVLVELLSELNSAPLNKAFVDVPSGQVPWAASMSHYVREFVKGLIQISFTGVHTKRSRQAASAPSSGSASYDRLKDAHSGGEEGDDHDDVDDASSSCSGHSWIPDVPDDGIDRLEPGVFHDRLNLVLCYLADNGFSAPVHALFGGKVSATPSPADEAAAAAAAGGMSSKEAADLALVHAALRRVRLSLYENLEHDANEHIVEDVLTPLLMTNAYKLAESTDGNAAQNASYQLDLSQFTSVLKVLGELQYEPLSFWTDLFRRYLVDSPCMEVIAVPSSERAQQIDRDRRALETQRRNAEVIESPLRVRLDALGTQPASNEELVELCNKLRQTIIDEALEANKFAVGQDEIDTMPPLPSLSKVPRFPCVRRQLSLGSIVSDPTSDAVQKFGTVHVMESETFYEMVSLCIPLAGMPRYLIPYMLLTDLHSFESSKWIPDGSNKSVPADVDLANSLRRLSARAGYPEPESDGHGYMLVEDHVAEEAIAADCPAMETMFGCDDNWFTCSSHPFMMFARTGALPYTKTAADGSQLHGYSRIIRWLVHSIIGTHFSPSRILTMARRGLDEIVAVKQDSYKTGTSVQTRLGSALDPDPRNVLPHGDDATLGVEFSMIAHGSVMQQKTWLAQQSFLQFIVDTLEKDPEATGPAGSTIMARFRELHGFVVDRAGKVLARAPLTLQQSQNAPEAAMKFPGYAMIVVPKTTGHEVTTPSNPSVEAIARELATVWDSAVAGYRARRDSLGWPRSTDSAARLADIALLPVVERPHPFWLPRVPFRPFNSKPSAHVVYSPAANSYAVNITTPLDVQGANLENGQLHRDTFIVKWLADTISRSDGILFNAVRGLGYAYGAFLSYARHNGFMRIGLYRATSPIEGTIAARDVLKRLSTDSDYFEKEITSRWQMDLTRMLMYRSVLDRMASSTTMFEEERLILVFGYDSLDHYSEDAIKHIHSITADDLRRVYKQWFAPLFEPETPMVAVLVSPPLASAKTAEAEAERELEQRFLGCFPKGTELHSHQLDDLFIPFELI